MAVCQNLVPLVNIKIAGKWMFIPLKMVLIGIDPYPYLFSKPLGLIFFFNSFASNSFTKAAFNGRFFPLGARGGCLPIAAAASDAQSL